MTENMISWEQRACKVSALGVLYGYGDRAELEDAGADWIVSTPAKITEKYWEGNELVSLTKNLSEPGIDLT